MIIKVKKEFVLKWLIYFMILCKYVCIRYPKFHNFLWTNQVTNQNNNPMIIILGIIKLLVGGTTLVTPPPKQYFLAPGCFNFFFFLPNYCCSMKGRILNLNFLCLSQPSCQSGENITELTVVPERRKYYRANSCARAEKI